MNTSLIQIGNSKGVRIPKPLIEICHLDKEIEFIVTEKGLLLSPSKSSRNGWELQFKNAIIQEKAENDLFEGMKNKFDEEEWTW